MKFPLSSVELVRNLVALLLGYVGHAFSFWKVLTNKTVNLFVASPFPGVIRVSKIKLGSVLLFNLLVLMKLSAVIRCNGFKSQWLSPNQTDCLLAQGGGRLIRKFTHHHIARFSLQ